MTQRLPVLNGLPLGARPGARRAHHPARFSRAAILHALRANRALSRELADVRTRAWGEGRLLTRVPLAVPALAHVPASAGSLALGAASAAAGTALPSTATLPASVDLSGDAMPVANQGSVNACVSWVTLYGQMGWYLRHTHLAPATFTGLAPLYAYSQIVAQYDGGKDSGGTESWNYAIATSQGVDTRADYQPQGDSDYKDQPTAAQRAKAAYKATGDTQVIPMTAWYDPSTGANPGQAGHYVRAALAAGQPLAMGLGVYASFMNAPKSGLIDTPKAGETFYGYHEVLALGYDATGVWFENSWGTGWGANGYGHLTWAFVNGAIRQAYALTGVTVTAAPATTATATPVPPTATATPRPTNTATATPRPTNTATATPRPTTTPLPPTASATAR